jgi:hypothetical protein
VRSRLVRNVLWHVDRGVVGFVGRDNGFYEEQLKLASKVQE